MRSLDLPEASLGGSAKGNNESRSFSPSALASASLRGGGGAIALAHDGDDKEMPTRVFDPPMTFGSFLPFSVFLQAPIQGVALVVNTLAEAFAGLGVSIIGASVRALELRIARADVVHKLVDDDH